MTYWLNVHYVHEFYDVASADALIFGALGLTANAECDSRVGAAMRDLHFSFESHAAALAAREKLLAAGIPLVFEATVSWDEEER